MPQDRHHASSQQLQSPTQHPVHSARAPTACLLPAQLHSQRHAVPKLLVRDVALGATNCVVAAFTTAADVRVHEAARRRGAIGGSGLPGGDAAADEFGDGVVAAQFVVCAGEGAHSVLCRSSVAFCSWNRKSRAAPDMFLRALD